MLIAKTVSGERIDARYAEKGYDYYCQMCDKELILKKGSIKIHHFAHYAKDVEACHWWEPETETHKQMKLNVYEVISSRDDIELIEMEYAINDALGRLIPDVYIELSGGGKIAVECQVSPKSLDDILTKTIRYSDIDVHSLWIVPSRIIKRVPKSLKHFLKLLYRGTLYFLDDNKLSVDGYNISSSDLCMFSDNEGLKLVGYEGMNFDKYDLEYNYDMESLNNIIKYRNDVSNVISVPNDFDDADNHVDVPVSSKHEGKFLINKEGEHLDYKELVSQVLSMPRFGYSPYDIADSLKMDVHVVDMISCRIPFDNIVEYITNKH